jgi:hypothetical protein
MSIEPASEIILKLRSSEVFASGYKTTLPGNPGYKHLAALRPGRQVLLVRA